MESTKTVSEPDVRQEEDLAVENEAACVTETIVNVEGIAVATTKEGARQVNAEERLVLKRLKELSETKVHDDIPSVKNNDWKKTKGEAELLNNAIANVNTNSESEENKLLASAAFQVAEIARS